MKTRSWTYDGAGNVATDVQSVDAYVYSYNKASRLSSVTYLSLGNRPNPINDNIREPFYLVATRTAYRLSHIRGLSTIICTISNVSEGGAKLQLQTVSELPGPRV